MNPPVSKVSSAFVSEVVKSSKTDTSNKINILQDIKILPASACLEENLNEFLIFQKSKENKTLNDNDDIDDDEKKNFEDSSDNTNLDLFLTENPDISSQKLVDICKEKDYLGLLSNNIVISQDIFEDVTFKSVNLDQNLMNFSDITSSEDDDEPINCEQKKFSVSHFDEKILPSSTNVENSLSTSKNIKNVTFLDCNLISETSSHFSNDLPHNSSDTLSKKNFNVEIGTQTVQPKRKKFCFKILKKLNSSKICKRSHSKLKSLAFYLDYIINLDENPTQQNVERLKEIFDDLVNSFR